MELLEYDHSVALPLAKKNISTGQAGLLRGRGIHWARPATKVATIGKYSYWASGKNGTMTLVHTQADNTELKKLDYTARQVLRLRVAKSPYCAG